MGEPGSDNRRKHDRVRIEHDIIVNNSTVAEALDISEDGMYVYVTRTFLENSIISLDFQVEDTQICITAAVCHSQPNIGFGVSFMDIPVEIKETLQAYLRKKLG